MLKNLGFDMTSSKKENGANRDQDEIGELGSLFHKSCVDSHCPNRVQFYNLPCFCTLGHILMSQMFSVCEEGPGICSLLLTIGSLLLIFASLPLSLYVVVKVVQVRIL